MSRDIADRMCWDIADSSAGLCHPPPPASRVLGFAAHPCGTALWAALDPGSGVRRGAGHGSDAGASLPQKRFAQHETGRLWPVLVVSPAHFAGGLVVATAVEAETADETSWAEDGQVVVSGDDQQSLAAVLGAHPDL